MIGPGDNSGKSMDNITGSRFLDEKIKKIPEKKTRRG